MIPILIFAAALSDLPGGDPARFAACAALAKSNPDQAVVEADAWSKKSRDIPARHCLALAYAGAERWTEAAVAFEQAAAEAEGLRDGRAATLWTGAGNAALAADDPTRARAYLDHALALPTLADRMRGEVWFDRARADVAIDDLPTARYDLDQGVALVPQDPFGWLLSATLARRQNDPARAAKDIAEAARLAPDDASVALEQGNIAAVAGDNPAARDAWARAARLAPGDADGKAAAAALAAAQ